MLVVVIKTQFKGFFFFSVKLVKPTSQKQLSYIKTLPLHSPINKTQTNRLFFFRRFCTNQPQTNNNPKTTSLPIY